MAAETTKAPGRLDELLERVGSAVGERASELKLNFGLIDFICRPEQLVETVALLRDSDGLECKFFGFLSGVDRSELGEGGGGLEVLIVLYSPEHNFEVAVHVPVDPSNPICPTISGVYSGALWHERETHEMFGIFFEGHPRLSNLYLPEDFEGHPGLRSFKLPGRTVKAWPGAKDPAEAAAGGR